MILEETSEIQVESLPDKLRLRGEAHTNLITDRAEVTLEELEREYLLKVLEDTNWQKKTSELDPRDQRVDALPEDPAVRPREVPEEGDRRLISAQCRLQKRRNRPAGAFRRRV